MQSRDITSESYIVKNFINLDFMRVHFCYYDYKLNSKYGIG